MLFNTPTLPVQPEVVPLKTFYPAHVKRLQFGQEGGNRAPRERISREKERSTSGPPDIASTRSALQVGARGVWELGDSGLGAALPPRNSHSKMAVTTLSGSEL